MDDGPRVARDPGGRCSPDLPADGAVSVVIVNFNAGSLLTQAVRSCLAQTVQPVQCVVMDNASRDDSIATLQRERDAAEDLLAHQNVALDEAEATIERLRAELREAREKTGGKTDGDAETEARQKRGDDDGEHGDASAAVERDGEVRSERDAYQVVSP